MSGLPGLEAIHAWTPPGGSAPVIELNRIKDDAFAQPVFPRYRLQRIGGLGSLGEPSAANDPRVGADGEIPRRGRRRGKTVTYEGDVVGRSRAQMRQAEEGLRAAFADISAEGRMDVSLHPNHPDAPYSRFFNARALALEIDDTLVPPTRSLSGGWERPFVLALRWSDARYFQDFDLAAFKQAIIDLGPSLYWTLNSGGAGLTDQSGNGRNGTAQGGIAIGGAAALTAISGDSATDFDGSNDLISCSYSPFVTNATRTFMGISWLDTLPSGKTLWGSSVGSRPLQSVVPPLPSDFTFRANLSGSITTGIEYPALARPVVWAVVTKDATNQVQAFIDGVGGGEVTDSDMNWPASPGNFQLGAFGALGTDTAPWDGKISHVAIFERALSAAEIAAVNELATTGLLGYY